MRRVIVLEINELPGPRVLRWWGEVNPSSELWSLATAGQLAETVLDEELHETCIRRKAGRPSAWVRLGLNTVCSGTAIPNPPNITSTGNAPPTMAVRSASSACYIARRSRSNVGHQTSAS